MITTTKKDREMTPHEQHEYWLEQYVTNEEGKELLRKAMFDACKEAHEIGRSHGDIEGYLTKEYGVEKGRPDEKEAQQEGA